MTISYNFYQLPFIQDNADYFREERRDYASIGHSEIGTRHKHGPNPWSIRALWQFMK
jgi:hypothetical protein